MDSDGCEPTERLTDLHPVDDVAEYVEKLGWTVGDAGVISLPSNPDNQPVSTVVQENIQLTRKFLLFFQEAFMTIFFSSELTKIITHAQAA